MAKILIIEDEKAINDLIAMNLSLVAHKCIQVYDGKEAVTVLENVRPDLILLDVMLPCTDGFSLMERKLFGDIPVIFVTAIGNTADKVK